MGSCGSGAKSSGANGGAGSGISNAKYNGFSVTDSEGNTENYVVINGIVDYADNRKFLGVSNMQAPEVMQNAYDSFGSVNAIIDRVNQNGVGKASILPDTEVERIREIHKLSREKAGGILLALHSAGADFPLAGIRRG